MTGRIYTMRCPVSNEIIYVGSTILSLRLRFGNHMSECKKGESKIHKHIRDTGIVPVVELVEEVHVSRESELRVIESYWIDQFRQWGFGIKNSMNNNPINFNKKYKSTPGVKCVKVDGLVIDRIREHVAMTGQTVYSFINMSITEELDRLYCV